MQYEHQIDELITIGIGKQGSLNPTKIHQLLVKTYNPKISPTTVQEHLDDLMIENVLERSKEKHRNNEQYYQLSEYAKRQLEYYGSIMAIKSQRESRGRDRKRSREELKAETVKNEIEIEENQVIIYLYLLVQSAGGSSRLKPAFRYKPPGWEDIPVYFDREDGVTMRDIIEHSDVGNGRIFSHIKFTIPMIEKCIDVLENNYGIDIEKHNDRHVNAFNTMEEYTTRAGSEPDDLVKRVERKNDASSANEIGIAIKDDNLRRFINIIACLIFMIADRIKYTWLFKRKPDLNSWEFQWHITFFGRERTLELIERSEHTLPSPKNEENKQKLTDYVRNKIENYWRGRRNDIDPVLIENDVQREIKTILHDKKCVDSLPKQTDRRITNLYHERIKCDRYERIYCDKHDQKVRCEKCQKFHGDYERYSKFARDILVNHNNKSNALTIPLLELVYPRKLRKLHENIEKKHKQ